MNNALGGDKGRNLALNISDEEWERIAKSDYGRDAGWIVEKAGEPVAILVEPVRVEMFWYSYLVQWLTEDEEIKEQIMSQKYWNTLEVEFEICFRNRQFGHLPLPHFPIVTMSDIPDRLTIRGLYFSREPHKLLEKPKKNILSWILDLLFR